MSFFSTSFASVGETLRTVSLAIGLLVTSVTGVGYIYNLISDQRAMAVEITQATTRIETLERESKDQQLYRYRIEQTEKGVNALNEKVDKLTDSMNDLKTLIIRN